MVEETVKMTSIDKPIREKVFVTTDESGSLKCSLIGLRLSNTG